MTEEFVFTPQNSYAKDELVAYVAKLQVAGDESSDSLSGVSAAQSASDKSHDGPSSEGESSSSDSSSSYEDSSSSSSSVGSAGGRRAAHGG